MATSVAAPVSVTYRQQVGATLACAHCGAPVAPADPRDEPAAPGPAFCCAGCATVYGAIAEFGLGRYYELSETRTPAKAGTARYGEFDDPAFATHHVRELGDGQAATTLYLEDLRCVGCMWLVETTPNCLPGVTDVTVNFGAGTADVVFNPTAVKLSAIARHIDRLGHPVHPARGLDRDAARKKEDRAMLIKLGVAGAAVGNLMLLAAALYAGMLGDLATRDEQLFRWASMIIALPTLSFAATPFFRAAWASLRSGILHLDLPLSIGIVAGLAWGAVNVVRHHGEIYFDSLAMLVFLLLLSRYLVQRQQRRATAASELLMALTPRNAKRVVQSGQARVAWPQARTEEVPIEALAVDDVIAVGPGEVVAVDGVVLEGASYLDCAVLSGEAAPRKVGPGDAVAAGTTNQSHPIWVRATAIGEATRLGKLAQFVRDVSQRKAPIEKMADAIAGKFVLTVLTIAVVTIAVWAALGNVVGGIEAALALLVVTCPCALALATPVAMAISMSRAAKRAILVKGADAMERLATPGALYIDKTGTVTEGKLAVQAWHGDRQYRSQVAAAEALSAHPIAKALCRDWQADVVHVVTEQKETFGAGIMARVDGVQLLIGAPRWVLPQCAATVAAQFDVAATLREIARAGETPVVVAADGQVVAVVALADQLRANSVQAITHLKAQGWRVALLSGDATAAATRVGGLLGCDDTIAEASPETKVDVVKQAAAHGAVVFVGDGVNDAAALAAASCGIAVSGSAEASMQAADVFLGKPGIAQVAAILDGARLTIGTIKRNFRISLLYNSVAGVLAVTGIIHPLIAALFMPISSLSIVLSSMASRAFKESV